MKTDYKLIKDFPKVLFEVNYNGEAVCRNVKSAHFCGKYGIEIDLGEGCYIYDRTYKNHERKGGSKGDYFENYGFSYDSRWCGFYVNEKRAYEALKQFKIEDERERKRQQVYSAYRETSKAGGILTFDFSKR